MKTNIRAIFTTASLLVAFLLSSISASPQAADAYYALEQKGKSQLQAGDSEQALASGEKAIELNPQRWEAYALAGGALMNLKRYEQAEDELSKAIETAPESKKAALRDLRKQCVLAEAGVAAPASTGSQAPPAQSAPTVTQAEVVLWKSIENSQRISDFEGYLRDYPTGAFATLAKQHVDELNDRAKQQLVRQEQPIAIIETSMGNLTCVLFPEAAPMGTANFIGLARGTTDWTDPKTHQSKHGVPLYDNTTFHRVIPSFMIQGGDPAGNGMGGPGYQFKNETWPNLRFDLPGRLAYANAGPGTNGSQFFITEVPSASLDGKYTIFGQCDPASVALVKKIARVPRNRTDRPDTPVIIKHIKIDDGSDRS